MVDCGNPRCLQEKRHLKKELLSWSKKIPFATGLELVAESLVGSGKIKTLLLPFNDLEPKTVQDWSPVVSTAVEPQASGSTATAATAAKLTTCAFCDGSSSATYLPSDSQSPSTTAGGRSEAEQAPMTPESSADYESAGSFGFAAVGAASGHLASHAAVSMHAATLHLVDDLDSPLDLSSSAPKRPAGALNTAAPEHKDVAAAGDHMADHRPAAELRVPEIHRVKKKKDSLSCNDAPSITTGIPFGSVAAAAAATSMPTGSGKRAYTELELRAAVEAIQSGAVGTRRAAQMYGVPRSTLRNKVFKATEMCQGSPPLPAAAAAYPGGEAQPLVRASHAGAAAAVAAATAAAAAANGSCSGASHQPTAAGGAGIKEEPTGSGGVVDDEEDTWVKKLQHLRHKHNLNATRASGVAALDAFGNVPFGYFGFNPFFLSPYAFDYSYAATSGLLMPYIPDLVKNLTHKRLELERSRYAAAAAATGQQQQLPLLAGAKPEAATRASSGGGGAASEEDLRVPLYRPAVAAAAATTTSCDGGSGAAATAPGSSSDESNSSDEYAPAVAAIAASVGVAATATPEGCCPIQYNVVGSRNGAASTVPLPCLKGDAPLNLSSAGHGGRSGGTGSSGEPSANKCSTSKEGTSNRRGKRPSDEEAAGVSSSAGAPLGAAATAAAAAAQLGGGSSGGGKNKRPKRGQYRKYDSELLAQAVRAVQRGEMSVHRAGTYFGVPHSTLEYKVKERHLLRKKKLAAESAARAAKKGDGGVGQSASGSSSAQAEADDAQASAPAAWPAAARNGSTSSLHSPADQLPPSGCDADGGTMAGYDGSRGMMAEATAVAALEAPVLSVAAAAAVGFALSTPASELLKKLQACANGAPTCTNVRPSVTLPRAATRSQEVAAAAAATSVDVQ